MSDNRTRYETRPTSLSKNRNLESGAPPFVERVVRFMLECINSGVTPELTDLAGAACLSKFHFHRAYRLMTGETCHQTMTRMRLAKATSALQDEMTSVTRVAFDVGYGSSQALAKAIGKATGESASALRKDPEKLGNILAQLSLPAVNQDGTRDGAPLAVTLSTLEPMEITLVRTKGKYPNLNSTYEGLFNDVEDPSSIYAILGISEGNNSKLIEGETVFDCALALNTKASAKTTTFGCEETYVSMRLNGGYGGLDDVIDELYLTVLRETELALADHPIIMHYLDDPEEVPEEQLRTDVYLPVVVI